ncbi:MAG: EscU/YscU/HrcU family type III secretion system export apparatus switch protein [Armatimonadota bacterium]
MLKRYEPSARKLQWLHRRGMRPISRTVVAAVVVASGLLAVGVGAEAFMTCASRLLSDAMTAAPAGAADIYPWLWRVAALIGLSAGCIAAAVWGAWLVAAVMQTGSGMVYSGGEGVNYYSMDRSQAADTAVRALISTFVIIAAVYAGVEAARAIGANPTAGAGELVSICCVPAVTVFLPAAAGAVVLDLIWCRYAYVSAARMGEREKRRELRDTETGAVTQQRRSYRRQEESTS